MNYEIRIALKFRKLWAISEKIRPHILSHLHVNAKNVPFMLTTAKWAKKELIIWILT